MTSPKTLASISPRQKRRTNFSRQPRPRPTKLRWVAISEKQSERRGVGFCYRKYPVDSRQAQSRDMIKGWEQQQTEVVEENPSYYNYSDEVNVQNRHRARKKAIKYTEKKSKGACNTCFYKAER